MEPKNILKKGLKNYVKKKKLSAEEVTFIRFITIITFKLFVKILQASF